MKTYSTTKIITWSLLPVLSAAIWKFIYIPVALALFAFLFSSCSKTELVDPQMLRYEVDGEAYAQVYDASLTERGINYFGEPFIREIRGTWETPASVGDSVFIFAMPSNMGEDVTVRVWLGDRMISEGSSEGKGMVSIRGRLGRELFVVRRK